MRAIVVLEVHFHWLGARRHVVDAQNALAVVLADKCQNVRVVLLDLDVGTAAESAVLLADVHELAHPVQQRIVALHLRVHVDDVEAVLVVADRREVEPLRLGLGEPAVAVVRPLHGGAHPVAVLQPDVVAHPDLVTVVEERRARQRQQQRVGQLEAVAVPAEQRR